MSHVLIERRDGRLRLYLHGDLQFDASDERRYHEPLALVPVALAARRAPGHPLRVLILGGGDGLALREVLRCPEVVEVHVVDRDPEVLALGRSALGGLNRDAFADPRVRVRVADAREALGRRRAFDVVIYDLTYPEDVAGAALFSLGCLRRVGAALRPGGVLAMNAVSPEATPEAFGCIGWTLGAAGLPALPYAFDLPSFREEGYGRWGFLFASSRPIGRAELRALGFPGATGLTPEALLAGTRLPAGAARAMRVAPNSTDELLYHLHNATPLAWTEPLRPLRFGPTAPAVGPRLTAAEGFARWLRAPSGRRSLERLLDCIPLSHRGQTRAALLEWAHHAEALLREVDLRAFVEQTLRRAGALPRAWRCELALLERRLRAGFPPVRELFEQAYRVFAVLLLLLLLANLFFPDNLYAKGFSGSRGGGGISVESSEPFHGFAFTDPAARIAPYRLRAAAARGRPVGPAARAGEPPPAEREDPRWLPLTAELGLTESGDLAYTPGVPGYRGLLEPGRLRVLDLAGRDVIAVLPGPALEEEARQQLAAQDPLLARALAEHARWLAWVGWASRTPPGREASAEMARLEALRRTLDAASAEWQRAGPSPLVLVQPGWVPVFPGIYVEAPGRARPGPAVRLALPTGEVRTRTLEPPEALAEVDRFLFRLLWRHAAGARDSSLRDALLLWVGAHPELGAPPGSAP